MEDASPQNAEKQHRNRQQHQPSELLAALPTKAFKKS